MTIRGSKQGKEAVTNFLATVAGSLRTLNIKTLLLFSTEECWLSGSDDLLGTLPFSCSEILNAGLIGTALPRPPDTCLLDHSNPLKVCFEVAKEPS